METQHTGALLQRKGAGVGILPRRRVPGEIKGGTTGPLITMENGADRLKWVELVALMALE